MEEIQEEILQNLGRHDRYLYHILPKVVRWSLKKSKLLAVGALTLSHILSDKDMKETFCLLLTNGSPFSGDIPSAASFMERHVTVYGQYISASTLNKLRALSVPSLLPGLMYSGNEILAFLYAIAQETPPSKYREYDIPAVTDIRCVMVGHTVGYMYRKLRSSSEAEVQSTRKRVYDTLYVDESQEEVTYDASAHRNLVEAVFSLSGEFDALPSGIAAGPQATGTFTATSEETLRKKLAELERKGFSLQFLTADEQPENLSDAESMPELF